MMWRRASIPSGDDIDKLLATVICANRLALGLIRLYLNPAQRIHRATVMTEFGWFRALATVAPFPPGHM
jgi:hypothetical protein